MAGGFALRRRLLRISRAQTLKERWRRRRGAMLKARALDRGASRLGRAPKADRFCNSPGTAGADRSPEESFRNARRRFWIVALLLALTCVAAVAIGVGVQHAGASGASSQAQSPSSGPLAGAVIPRLQRLKPSDPWQVATWPKNYRSTFPTLPSSRSSKMNRHASHTPSSGRRAQARGIL